MSSEFAIECQSLSKCYHIYAKPRDRLLQILHGKYRKYYKEFWALKDISFNIGKGETVGIIGTNGSGKSTLLQIICETLSPTTGTIHSAGRIAALLELGAGFNPEFTGRENVFLNAAILGLTKKQVEEKFQMIEAFAEIGNFIDQPVKTYSSGMYVRLAFAVAIHTDPSILIVDEALSVGDARFQAKCLDRIKEMKNSGVSILFVSHDVNAVRNLCDRAIWIDKGVMKLEGDVIPVTSKYTEYLFSHTETDNITKSDDFGVVADEDEDTSDFLATPPINHWGSALGTIIQAGIYNSANHKVSTITDFEDLTVRIKFKPNPSMDMATLGAAFSIKDLSGSDLIVGATYSKNLLFGPGAKTATAEFKLQNQLGTGNYFLVVALEDRSAATIHYYEYIEGVQFFSSAFTGNPSGKFMSKIEMTIHLH